MIGLTLPIPGKLTPAAETPAPVQGDPGRALAEMFARLIQSVRGGTAEAPAEQVDEAVHDTSDGSDPLSEQIALFLQQLAPQQGVASPPPAPADQGDAPAPASKPAPIDQREVHSSLDVHAPAAMSAPSEGDLPARDSAALSFSDMSPLLTVDARPEAPSLFQPLPAPAPLPDAAGLAPLEGALPADSVQHHLDLAHDAEWLDQLARDIARTADSGGRLRFQLNPEHLGSLHVEVTAGAQGASVRMTADSEAARSLIADAQPRLIAEARAQGMRIADAQIDLGQHGGGQRQSHGQQAAPFVRTLHTLPEPHAGTGTPTTVQRDRYA